MWIELQRGYLQVRLELSAVTHIPARADGGTLNLGTALGNQHSPSSLVLLRIYSPLTHQM